MQTINVQLPMYVSSWFRYFLRFDSAPMLEEVTVPVPVLALVGEKDLQVPPKENLALIEASPEEGR